MKKNNGMFEEEKSESPKPIKASKKKPAVTKSKRLSSTPVLPHLLDLKPVTDSESSQVSQKNDEPLKIFDEKMKTRDSIQRDALKKLNSENTPLNKSKRDSLIKGMSESATKLKANFSRFPIFGLEDEAENIASPFSSTKIGSAIKRHKPAAAACVLGDVTNEEAFFMASPAKITKTAVIKKNGFDQGLLAETILDLDESNGNRLFLVKWSGSNKTEYGNFHFSYVFHIVNVSYLNIKNLNLFGSFLTSTSN